MSSPFTLTRILLFFTLLLIVTTAFAQPEITGFSPSSAPAGATVTITGYDFSEEPSFNIVYFGAVRASVSRAASNRLQVVVPRGATYQPISVTVLTLNRIAYSPRPFVPTFTNPFGSGISANFYKPTVNINNAGAGFRYSSAVSDLDGDGKPDLVIVNPTANTVSVLRNTAQTGTINTAAFGARVDFPTGTELRSVTVADIDNDGNPDIVVANRGSNSVSVLHNLATNGSISSASFADKVDFATGINPEQVVASDLDGDGWTDLVVLERGSNSVSLLRNKATPYLISTASFAPGVSVEGIPAVPTRLAVGDLNGDRKPDLAVSGEVYSTIRLFRNNATPGSLTSTSFSSEGALATGVGATFTLVSFYLEIADIDGDQRADIVGGCSAPNKLFLYLNTTPVNSTTFSFAGRAEPDVSNGLNALGIGDADGDGKLDLLIGNTGNSISVLRNVSTPGSLTAASLAPKVDFTTDFSPTSISLADIDGNGIPELVDVNQTQSVSLLQVNNPPSQTPVVILFTPDKGPAGTTVTITGLNFNPTPAKNIVYFGAVRADVTGGSSTSLTVKAPAGATYQPLTVMDSATGLTGWASKPFNTLFTNPFGTGIPVNFYRQGVVFPSPTTIRTVAISDLDGDRKPDLITTNFPNSRTISVLRNKTATGVISSASFESPVSFSSTAVNSSVGGPYEVATGDLDGDGKPEIVISNYGSGTVEVFRNQSVPGVINSTSFAAPVTFNLGANPPGAVVISDLDGDGKPELIAGAEGASRIAVFVNTTTRGSITAASFSNRIDLPTAGPASSVTVRDLDQDGKPDIIAVVRSINGPITIFPNIANPGTLNVNSFAPRVDLPVGGFTTPSTVAVADFDGDGRQDIVCAGNFSVRILQNTGTTPGNITTQSFSDISITSASSSISLVVDDLDGDGKPDIADPENSSPFNDFTIRRNISNPGPLTYASFTSTVPSTGGFYTALASGDLDGDGIPEMVAVNSGGSSGISVFKINAPSALLPPSITQLSPSSGPVGTVVTISGSNFNPVPDGNVVYFGAVKVTVTTASATSLTVVVPAGVTNQPVSVLNTASGLTGYAAKPFITTFTNPLGSGIPGNFYKPKINVATGTLPYAATLGDLNSDGKPDVVAINQTANTISILRNTSGPVGALFAAKVDLPVGSDPRAVAVGDVTGDGRPDIVVVSTAGSSIVSVLRNISTAPGGDISSASFDRRVDFAVGATPSSVAIGDADGDGRPDLVVTSLAAGTVSVLRNTGQSGAIYPPSFAAPVSFAAGTYPRFVTVSDLDGDGKVDIALVNERSNSVSVLRNTATAGTINASSFAPMSSYPTGNNPNYVTASDMDGDGKPDLVITNFGSNTVSVLRNTAMPGTLDAGSFASKVDFATGSQPFSATTGDADGDGKLDIITANAGSNTLSVLRNLAAPGNITASSFASKTDFPTGNYPVGITMGDLDDDGIPELVSVNAGSNSVFVLTVNIPGPPAITLFTPSSSPAGATITITGANFNPSPAGNQVYFGAVKAVVTDGNSGNLTVKVPAGATYQPVTVLNSATGLIGYSSRSFISTFANPFSSGIPANFYRPKVDFSTGASAFLYAVAFGDLDGDGKPDMVGVNRIAQTISVLRNTSATGTIAASSFAAPLVISTPNYPESVVLADMDDDGKLDIITANPGSYSFSILRNTASSGVLTAASFAARVDISTGVYISSLAAGDLDRDGKTDIAVTNLYSSTVSVFRNVTATGIITASSFAAKIDYTAGDFPRVVVIKDINNDNKPELIVANERSNNVSVLNNTASPGFITPASFDTKINYAAGSSPSGVAAGDLDEDGKPEIVVCNYGSNSVSVLRNTSSFGILTTESFAAKIDFGTGTRPFFVALGDADGDSLVDLITANSGSDNVSVLRNAGSINTITAQSFVSKADFGTSGYPLWVALGDLDGDGIAELATANASNATISVLKVGAPALAAAQAASPRLQATTEAASTGTLQLYPNPTPGDFTLQLQGLKGATAQVEVLGETGKQVVRSVVNTGGKAAWPTLKLSLRSQPAGVYYVKVTSISGVQITKVIVQR